MVQVYHYLTLLSLSHLISHVSAVIPRVGRGGDAGCRNERAGWSSAPQRLSLVLAVGGQRRLCYLKVAGARPEQQR
jgi:hypothetical protein